MIDREPSAPKRAARVVAILTALLLAAYAVFVGVLSMGVGIRSRDSDGYWMPILVGGLIITLVLSVFVAAVMRAGRRAKERAGHHPAGRGF